MVHLTVEGEPDRKVAKAVRLGTARMVRRGVLALASRKARRFERDNKDGQLMARMRSREHSQLACPPSTSFGGSARNASCTSEKISSDSLANVSTRASGEGVSSSTGITWYVTTLSLSRPG